MPWIQIAIETTQDNAEFAEDSLLANGAMTVTYTDAADQPILEPGVDQVPIWNEVIITGLFDGNTDQNRLLDAVKQATSSIDCTISIDTLADQNWTRAWMDDYHAMQFGQRLWVIPMHIDPPDASATNLRLDPGLAFGTGTHPTTALCLKWLDSNISKQQSLLDYGCGSGILAIAACMLGVQHADGVDIDPQALIATRDNAASNTVSDKISTWLPDDYQRERENTEYDIVIANILSGPLAELAPTLARHTRTGGDIALSGILKEQAQSVTDAYDAFFDMKQPVYQDDWVLLHGIKKQTNS